MGGSCKAVAVVSCDSLMLFSCSVVSSFVSIPKFSVDFGFEVSSEHGDELQQLLLSSFFTVSGEIRNSSKLQISVSQELLVSNNYFSNQLSYMNQNRNNAIFVANFFFMEIMKSYIEKFRIVSALEKIYIYFSIQPQKKKHTLLHRGIDDNLQILYTITFDKNKYRKGERER